MFKPDRTFFQALLVYFAASSGIDREYAQAVVLFFKKGDPDCIHNDCQGQDFKEKHG